jgi:hypothetical protein
VGATALQLDAFVARENNPHPSPPPTWGREKSSRLLQMRLPCPARGEGNRIAFLEPLRFGES